MGFTFTDSIPVITVLAQGFLSFFSPCVLPLLPMYIAYLSGGTVKVGSDGREYYDRKKVLVNTIFFVIGIAFSFFILGLGMQAVGRFFSGNQILFARIGGIIVIAFGLVQLGVLGQSGFLSQDHRLPFKLDKMAMSPITALIMGFVFSFAWTPCVGPTLSSVLLMSASAENSLVGFALIGVYTAGFIIPFLLAGIFTTSILSLFKKHRNIVKYTAKIGGALLIFMGIMMLTGLMNNFTGYLSRVSGSAGNPAAAAESTVESQTAGQAGQSAGAVKNSSQENLPENNYTEESQAAEASAVAEETKAAAENKTTEESQTAADNKTTEESQAAAESTATEEARAAEESGAAADSGEKGASGEETMPAPDFTLKDQYGNTHTLSDYKGKIVFLNFWATWCPPCRAEMPDIQAIYEETCADPDSDLVILGVAFPEYGREENVQGITDFLNENGYTYPVVMDTEASLARSYYITAYPTTFMIDKEGNIYGYASGGLSRHIMDDIIAQTRAGK